MNEYLISKLREGRLSNGLKQSDVTKLTGIKNTTLSNYENGITEPDIDTFLQLCELYKLDYANILGEAYGLSVQGADIDIKPSEIEHIKKYRNLDDHGKETVSYILDRESDRVQQIKEATESDADSNVRYIQRYPRLASAGTGQVVFEDMPVEQIAIPDIPEYKRVSYAIEVNGNSMEPVYHDEDVLLVEPACQIDVGEIGIFIVGNDAYVKKLGDGELISLNKGYSNIPLTEDSKCMGRVVDKL